MGVPSRRSLVSFVSPSVQYAALEVALAGAAGLCGWHALEVAPTLAARAGWAVFSFSIAAAAALGALRWSVVGNGDMMATLHLTAASYASAVGMAFFGVAVLATFGCGAQLLPLLDEDRTLAVLGVLVALSVVAVELDRNFMPAGVMAIAGFAILCAFYASTAHLPMGATVPNDTPALRSAQTHLLLGLALFIGGAISQGSTPRNLRLCGDDVFHICLAAAFVCFTVCVDKASVACQGAMLPPRVMRGVSV